MAVEMAIWRMSDGGAHQLVSSPLDSEQRLEDMLAEDPSMSGTNLLIIGRQVRTGFGGVHRSPRPRCRGTRPRPRTQT